MIVVDLGVTANFRVRLRSCAGNLFRFTALREISAPRRDALWTCVVIASCACVCGVRRVPCGLPYVEWTLCSASARSDSHSYAGTCGRSYGELERAGTRTTTSLHGSTQLRHSACIASGTRQGCSSTLLSSSIGPYVVSVTVVRECGVDSIFE